MIRFHVLIIICSFIYMGIYGQEKPEYFINKTDSGQYLVLGSSFFIDMPANACYEYPEYSSLSIGNKFIIMRIMDEMDNMRGVIIFDKKGKQINYEKVQKERAKFYEHYNCCIYVKELNGKLYFWDVIEPNADGKDYDCYYDSQTDASAYLIPRYYIFNPKKGSLETRILKSKCTKLIQNAKVICD